MSTRRGFLSQLLGGAAALVLGANVVKTLGSKSAPTAAPPNSSRYVVTRGGVSGAVEPDQVFTGFNWVSAPSEAPRVGDAYVDDATAELQVFTEAGWTPVRGSWEPSTV